MKISRAWLQNFFNDPLPDTGAVADALTFHAFEIDGIKNVRFTKPNIEDVILDVKVTPNRGHDCLSHRGIAKELSAILKLPLNVEKDPFAKKPDLSKTTDIVSVSLDTPLAKRYIAGVVRGVKVGPSPDWLRQSLEAMGQKSVNNVVDATNMVMFNTGQPLHAFDIAKLTADGGKLAIAVRPARAGETMVALDEKEYELDESMLVIADANADTAIGIAGVKGGMPAAITEATTDILIESANFDGVSVRKTAQTLKLRTDASTRFEQVISPELAAYGMQQAVEVIVAIAGGEAEGFVDTYPQPQKASSVSVTLEKINRVLGVELSSADVAEVFTRLGFTYKEASGAFEITPPFERLDLEIAEDLIEEVGRISGYDTVAATGLPLDSARGKPLVNPQFFAAEAVREDLTKRGYSEVITSVFTDKGERAVANKIGGDKPYLRDSLIPGLEDALLKNKPNKELLGLAEVKLFEIGTVWKDGEEKILVGTISEKEQASEEELKPIEADHYDDLPLSAAERYQPFSKYPFISRDIAMWVPSETAEDDVQSVLAKTAGELCVRLERFDRFEKENRVSYAFRLIFQSFEKTLTDAEVQARMDAIYATATAKGWEVR